LKTKVAEIWITDSTFLLDLAESLGYKVLGVACRAMAFQRVFLMEVLHFSAKNAQLLNHNIRSVIYVFVHKPIESKSYKYM